MKVPISWLNEYVDFDASAEELADRLTFSGIEVEGIETVGSDYAGIVAGEVMEIRPHPGADRLRLCRVNNGSEELDVVCGADNFKVGDKAPFVGVGVTLPAGIKVRKSKIRGCVSMGMLCAEDELGISDDHSGILLLDPDTPAGTPLSEVLGPPETVLDLEITWNRPDCLCILGIAREVAALFRTGLKLPPVDLPEEGKAVEELVRVTIEDPAGCPRYTARVLSDIKMGPSPSWMQKRLNLCGVRPISNIVDITNYVMLECGQPLHAFDYRLIEDGHIIVRRSAEGETMRTLDEIDRDITPEMLLIADGRGTVALAGVMGGAGSEISDETSTVLLESACFSPVLTHATSAKLGLSTESSHRFERGVDVGGVDWCSRRAARLMVDHAGAKAARGVIDCYHGKREAPELTCRYERVRGLLGIEISADEIIDIFNRLQIPVADAGESGCTVRVPTFRPDLEIEADLIEEVARIHGLEDVPDAWPSSRIVLDADDDETRAVRECRHNLLGLGLSECMHYSFVSASLLDFFNPADGPGRVVLPNPVSAEYAVMRNSLVPQMMESMGRNLAHQADTASLFEIGRVFHRNDDGTISEEDRLSMGIMGPSGRIGPDGNKPVEANEVFLWLKGIIEQLCAAQHVDSLEFRPCSHAVFEEGAAVLVHADGLNIGVLGIPRQDIRHKWRMIEPVAVAELELKPLCRKIFRISEIEPVPVYPGIRRDVALIVDESVTHDDIRRVIRKNAPADLTSVTLFDIFTGEGMEKGQKSLAFSLVYRSSERSLTDEDANTYHESIKDALKKGLKVKLRDG